MSGMSESEALMAMLALVVVLAMILAVYCMYPLYTEFKRRRQQERDFWETDPRWNRDRFQFTPKWPEDYLNDSKFSASCSRSSSLRSAATDVSAVEAGKRPSDAARTSLMAHRQRDIIEEDEEDNTLPPRAPRRTSKVVYSGDSQKSSRTAAVKAKKPRDEQAS